MYAGMKHFPHKRHAVAAQGNCGFGHLLTYNTPEAVNESMPRWVEAARLLFVAEGRIDNRDELCEALGISAGERLAMPDGDLMLRAYLQWDEKCVDRLMGKWSLAAFHSDEQRLFMARDKWDYTAIDYYMDDKVCAFATSSQGLFPLPFIKKELDELMIARLLVIWPGDHDKTYFKGIRRLLPSRALRVTQEKDEVYRYWNFTDIKVREGLKLEDYVADLFANLNKAVTARLRSYRPVAATLSGGMNSSTVCVLAAEHLAKQGKRLRTYSHVPQFAPSQTLSHHKFGDERPFIEAVVAASGNIDPVFSDSAGISPLQGIAEGIRLYGQPFHGVGNAYWLVDLFKTAVRDGYGTVNPAMRRPRGRGLRTRCGAEIYSANTGSAASSKRSCLNRSSTETGSLGVFTNARYLADVRGEGIPSVPTNSKNHFSLLKRSTHPVLTRRISNISGMPRTAPG
jgi:asparagine synthase (glutamine-hydrolysing)